MRSAAFRPANPASKPLRELAMPLAGRNEEWVDRIEELWFAVWPLTGENHELRSYRDRRKTIPGQHW